jgi:tetratricopeptide (TPR) repeat protein
MRSWRARSVLGWIASALAIFLLVPPAAAQEFRDDTWQLCFSDMAPPDFSVGACTALIESGRETRENLAAALFNRANAFASRRLFDRAVQDYGQALRLLPDDAEFLANRGHALIELGRVDEAIADYDRALRQNPKLVAALDGRCNAHAIQNRIDAALGDCEAALAQAPDDPLIRENRGFVALKAGDWRGAIGFYDGALAGDRDNALALWGRGYANERLGRRAEAQRDYAAARRALKDVDRTMAARGLAR